MCLLKLSGEGGAPVGIDPRTSRRRRLGVRSGVDSRSDCGNFACQHTRTGAACEEKLDHESRNSGRTWKMKQTIVMLAAIPLVSLLAACGGSGTAGTPTPGATATATSTPVATPTPTAIPTPTAVTAGPLSGGWTGQYSGTFHGTFTLTWQQAGSGLDGTIVLSAPPQTLHITGNAAGNAITFGTVGGVEYSGSVSGNSMSGTYTVPNGGGGGTWSATKS
jgi:hypothetical protein